MADDRYKEEQQNELEILQSIYPTEFTEISAVPPKFSLRLTVDDDDIRPHTLDLTVEYTATYPDALPLFDIAAEDIGPSLLGETDAVLGEGDIAVLRDKTSEVAADSLGMAMVFSMATVLKEAAEELLRAQTAELKQKRELRIQREIEAEQAKFVGTLVTRAGFLEWKARFEREMQAEESGDPRARRAGVAGPRRDDRLTGRQLFEQDRTLAQSDTAFVADGDVSVDTSLFTNEDVSDDSDQ
ncbi:rwd domain-containing protein [Coemansia spiralis]|uniref:Rwd domain-containing protein n=2 Tax=Coemansia TaxID=4863 RepID=A0A9W8G2X3_9FUNG|nr:rwd domain-containing protein [Coemansia umbellata]KAJ2620358.1 rwd domain-containing protein [Coemansia sp. RSA 1358]KAJ2669648.1 rwd domain-containing protein [Coemansia spiralis]